MNVFEFRERANKGQAIGYLQALDLQLALLVNFHVPLLRNGIKRVINTYKKT